MIHTIITSTQHQKHKYHSLTTMAATHTVLSLILSISLSVLAAAAVQGPVTAPSPFVSKAPPMAPSPSISEAPPVAPSPFLSEAPASAVAPAPPGLDCTDSLLNISACLTYVEEGSKVKVPEKGCCPGLASLVTNQPQCLCQLLASGESFGVKIDTTKALMLPTACKVEAPPVSLCAVLGIPVASPISPAGSPSSGGPEEPGSSTISGSPAAAPPNSKSGSTTTRATTGLATLTALLATALL